MSDVCKVVYGCGIDQTLGLMTVKFWQKISVEFIEWSKSLKLFHKYIFKNNIP